MPERAKQKPRNVDMPFAIVVIGAAALFGAAAFIRLQELSVGIDAGTSDGVPWGLLVVNYVAFIGLSAGGVIVSSLVHILNIRRFRPIATFAELLAIISILLVPVFIFLDLGRPERAVNLILFGRIESPLVWTVVVLSTYLVVCVAYLYYGVRRELVALSERPGRLRWLYRLVLAGYKDVTPHALARDERVVRRLAFVVLPLAVVLHSITGLIFAVVVGRPGYNTAIMPPLFVVSAVVSGIALVALVIVVAGKRVKLPVERGTVEELGRILAILLPILGYLLLMEWTVVFYGAEPGPLNVWQFITSGSYAALFWAMVIFGLLMPFLILAPRRTRTRKGVAVASALIVFGVMLERYLIVIAPLLFPSLPGDVRAYAPTSSEAVMVAGVYGLGILLLALSTKLFPIGDMYVRLRAREAGARVSAATGAPEGGGTAGGRG
ncbi:MAG TPA: NrfD/PsrC family molybdoenzyme membrane anchor subunit [Thermoplasmata archaeon]|nr:NrfD/PsrC family molybdoenzyme membrane anchor subunit [Thermoplasmata archaeon]